MLLLNLFAGRKSVGHEDLDQFDPSTLYLCLFGLLQLGKVFYQFLDHTRGSLADYQHSHLKEQTRT